MSDILNTSAFQNDQKNKKNSSLNHNYLRNPSFKNLEKNVSHVNDVNEKNPIKLKSASSEEIEIIDLIGMIEKNDKIAVNSVNL